MPVLILSKHKGWKWHKEGRVKVRGYAFNKDNSMLQGGALLLHFQSVRTESEFKQHLIELNGFFSVVIEGDQLYAAVDRLRSFPLFYFNRSDVFYITDKGALIGEKSSHLTWNDKSVSELLSAGYVTGEETLCQGLFQIPSCHYLVYDGVQHRTESYYQHYASQNIEKTKDQLYEAFDRISNAIFQRLIDVANGSQLVVPLSGGYDSRYIAVMLKELGCENVLCYTYGRKGSYEVEMAEKVAKKLNFEWKFVEYNTDKWKNFFHSKHFETYFRFSGNLTSNPHFQDFIAIEELLMTNSISEDSILVPGHSADLLAGKWIPVEVVEKNEKALLKEGLSKLIFKIHYALNPTTPTSDRAVLQDKISSLLQKDKYFSIEEYIKRYDQWNINERQAKFTVNSLRLFDYFGIKWVMPLWDNEFTDFWHRIELKHKIDKKLYHDLLMQTYFKKHGVDYTRHQNLTEKTMIMRLKQSLPYSLGNRLRRLIHFVRKWGQKEHFNAFDDAYILMHSTLMAVEKRHIKKTMNINQVVAQYYLHLVKRDFKS